MPRRISRVRLCIRICPESRLSFSLSTHAVNRSQFGATTNSGIWPVSGTAAYTPAIKVPGTDTLLPSSTEPRVPKYPLPIVMDDSTSRSRNGSKPSQTSNQPGSVVTLEGLSTVTLVAIALRVGMFAAVHLHLQLQNTFEASRTPSHMNHFGGHA